MDAAQLVELAEDIKANGMQTLIPTWIDDRETPGGDGPQTLLDGPDRIKALAQHLGITDPRDAPYSSSEGKKAVRYLRASEHPGLDPATLSSRLIFTGSTWAPSRGAG